jgi:hypothetical protein
MAGSQATISDFTNRFSTNLDTSSGGPIDNALTYAKELNQEFNSEANQTDTQTKNIELYTAYIHVRQHLERSVEEDSVGGASSVFEGDELATAKSSLRSWLNRAGGDTSMVDALSTTQTDSSRYVTSSG